MDLESLERTAVRAAYRSCEVLRARYGKLSSIAKKGPTDLVTDADLASETEVVAVIRAAYPDHAIVAEEGGTRSGRNDWRWLVDPLDGTVNYAHGVPFYAVSIACVEGDEVRVGVVLNPVNGELFTARAGGGACLNGQPIGVSPETRVSESLLATGFPYDPGPEFDRLAARFLRCLRESRGIRRLGSAALDLCYVACGRFAGYWESGLQPWDSAAGILIVREAGGRVTDFSNRPAGAGAREVLATNGRIHSEIISFLEVGKS
jgi:myo-inositol-1(or 4)-monophosphatase